MIQTIWHSGKGKTMETIKRSMVAKGGGREGRDEEAEHRKILGQWKYSVRYFNDGHM